VQTEESMNKIQTALKGYMDQIQELMESHPRAHLEENSNIHYLMSKASVYFAHMDDENRDYYQFVQTAIEDELEWNV